MNLHVPLVPAKAGTQRIKQLDSRLRGNEGQGRTAP
jgi:hypothetical protein